MPIIHLTQRIDKTIQKIIGISDGIVVCVNQHSDILLTFLYILCHRLIHLKGFRIFLGIVWSVTRTGMQDNQHFVFLARLNAFTKSPEQDTIIGTLLIGILSG